MQLVVVVVQVTVVLPRTIAVKDVRVLAILRPNATRITRARAIHAVPSLVTVD